jgi:hypothetical protein
MKKLLKALEAYDLNKSASGSVRFFAYETATKRIVKMIARHNLVLYGGADILSKLLSGAAGYHVSTMYLEYINLPSPGDPIVVPTFDRTGGVSYYNSLASSPDTDFMRVPLQIAPTLSSSNEDLYAFNKATFIGISEGTVGFHGKPFGPASNSAVYGAALVATPSPTDQAEDIVFSRVYAGEVSGWSEAIAKGAGIQIAATWTIQFN